MATVKPIKPKKPVDYVGYEPVMLAVSMARAMAWVLEQLHADNNLEHALQDAPAEMETPGWPHTVVADALREAHDDIEREYRKLGTNLLQKEASPRTSASFARLAAPPGDERPAGKAVGRGSRKGAPGEPRGKPDGAQAPRADANLPQKEARSGGSRTPPAAPRPREAEGRCVMAAKRRADSDIETLVESIRTRLLQAPDQAAALRYVHAVLDGWNPTPEHEALVAQRMAEHMAAAAEIDRREAEQERCPDCAEHKRRFSAAVEASGIAHLHVHCPAHPVLIFDDSTTSDTLREAGISSKRQTEYQRRMSSLLAGRA